MQAIAYHRYGPPAEVLKLEDTHQPVVEDDNVLVRVRAAGVNARDWHYVTGKPYIMRIMGAGLRRPKESVPGRDVAGQVEAVGRRVTRFQPGDEVYGSCDGACAEYARAAEDAIVAKPATVTFEQAAAVPLAAFTALQGLRDHGQVQPGQKVLITGASGGVGTFAVQIAKAFGAHVTAVCSTRNTEMVRSIGADHVIDYAQEDFTEGGERYDVIFDLAGNPPLSGCRRSLTRDGTLVMSSGEGGRWFGPMPRMVGALLRFAARSQRLRTFTAKESHDDLVQLTELIATGKVKAVIDRRYPLAETPDAVRYLEDGHTQGKVVITV